MANINRKNALDKILSSINGFLKVTFGKNFELDDKLIEYINQQESEAKFSCIELLYDLLKFQNLTTDKFNLVRTKRDGYDEKFTVSKWIEEVSKLFDKKAFGKENEEFLFTIELLIIGLGVLNSPGRTWLEANHLWGKLKAKLEKNGIQIPGSLSVYGRRMFGISDSVKVVSDAPILSQEADTLNRIAFCEYLVIRFRQIWLENQKKGIKTAFNAHLFGPWGVGKSSMLNLLIEALTSEENQLGNKKWKVVTYNAWRHQHIDPPWWTLLEAIYLGAKKELSYLNRIQEQLWRWQLGRIQ